MPWCQRRPRRLRLGIGAQLSSENTRIQWGCSFADYEALRMHRMELRIASSGHFQLHNTREIAVVTLSAVCTIQSSAVCSARQELGLGTHRQTRGTIHLQAAEVACQTGCAQHDVDNMFASSSTKLGTNITKCHAAQGNNDATVQCGSLRLEFKLAWQRQCQMIEAALQHHAARWRRCSCCDHMAMP